MVSQDWRDEPIDMFTFFTDTDTDTEYGGDPPNPPVVIEQPYSAVAAMCETLGTDPHVLDAKELSKQCKKAGELLHRGITVPEIRDYTAFMVSQDWRDEPIDMFTVAKGIGKWRMSGSPSHAKARAAPRKNGLSFDELAAMAQRAEGQ